MPRPRDITYRQTIFLRAFRTNPAGPPPELWPSPSILRRWLRRPGFRKALDSLLQSLRFQADFQLATAATQAATRVAASSSAQGSALTTMDLQRLLRLGHLRQRFQSTNGHNPSVEDADDDADADADAHEHEHEHDPFECLQRIPPDQRLTKEEFHRIAWLNHYGLPLEDRPYFPRPTPQDTFYYELVMNPRSLLWFMKLYDKEGNDHRFEPILGYCKDLMPNEPPDWCKDRFPQFEPQKPAPA